MPKTRQTTEIETAIEQEVTDARKAEWLKRSVRDLAENRDDAVGDSTEDGEDLWDDVPV